MKKVIILSMMLISMGITEAQASVPSPPMKDSISDYLLVKDLPIGFSPVTNLLSFADKLIIGGKDGVFTQQKNGEWKPMLQIPHSVIKLFESGGYAWAIVNKSKSKFRADVWVYRTRDGLTWEPCYKPHIRPLIAYDKQNKIMYRATKDIRYRSALFSAVEHIPLKLHDDKRLERICDIAVQSSSSHLLIGTHKELYLSKDFGKSFIPLNDKLGVPEANGHTYRLYVNDTYMLVEVDGYQLYLSRDGGESWETLSNQKPFTSSKGQWALRQILTLNKSRLMVKMNSDYFVMDLENGTFVQVHLPTYYAYGAFTIHDDMIYVAAQPPTELLMSNMAGRDRHFKAPLLKLSLHAVPACRLLAGNQKPEIFSGTKYIAPLVDGDSVYGRKDQFMWNVDTGKKLSERRIVSTVFTIGNRGHWYLKNAQIQNLRDDRFTGYTLMQSVDKGKSWQNTQTKMQQPLGSTYDDSLEISYSHYRWTVWKSDWKHNHATQHRFTNEEGEIIKLHVDNNSRLWVATTEGLFVSVPAGFKRIPLPFKTTRLPITGFALLTHHMVINYDNNIYISPIDEIAWRKYSLCDEMCNDDVSMAFRLVGHSDQLLVLQERKAFGHIWILNPATDSKERVFFPRGNGVIRKVQIRSNKQLLVETTGVPIIPDGEKNKGGLKVGSVIFSYNIHLNI
ncbi:beta propeller repeat protein [Seonamhaeicola marinus]|uniref:Exo-alpha-sialidase n=1 Tax=Seonamhaeicola marinus TaxID=1912246 RepID=A0A5D0HZK7_9FLAO|nr:hypothetical protein [Seonamhaeicola marinus]TYA74942.1 hypothetical protein FUA24_16720 [Seonamhaeicola marinus]